MGINVSALNPARLSEKVAVIDASAVDCGTKSGFKAI